MISQSFETLPPATFTVMGSSLCSSYKCEWQSSSTRPFKTCSSTTTSDGSGKNTKQPDHRNVVRILEVYHSIGFKPTFQVIYLAKNQISGTSGSITSWLCYNIPILHIAQNNKFSVKVRRHSNCWFRRPTKMVWTESS